MRKARVVVIAIALLIGSAATAVGQSSGRIDVRAGAAIPVSTRTRDYFGIGGTFDLAYNVLIPSGAAEAYVGAGLGTTYLQAEGDVRRGHALFVPLFAQVGVGMLPTSPVRPEVSVRFGGTVAHLSSNFAPRHTAVIPFAGASIGATFQVAAVALTAAVAGAYHAEPEIPIFLVTPSVGVSVSLE
ncbi:MAG: hypothetical protein ACLFP4_16990 [Spirochaetales bacterium]